MNDSFNEPFYIENMGADVINTNYFDSPYNKNGIFIVSPNAGAFRMLVPDIHIETVRKELREATWIIVKRYESEKRFEIMLEDFSNAPFVFNFSENSFLTWPLKSDDKGVFIFTAWARINGKILQIEEEKDCYYFIK